MHGHSGIVDEKLPMYPTSPNGRSWVPQLLESSYAGLTHKETPRYPKIAGIGRFSKRSGMRNERQCDFNWAVFRLSRYISSVPETRPISDALSEVPRRSCERYFLRPSSTL